MQSHVPFRVLKFGGTSVSTQPRWQNIAGIVQERLQQNPKQKVVVVCSALSGVSNQLEDAHIKACAGDYQKVVDEIVLKHKKLCQECDVPFDLLKPFMDELNKCALGASLLKEDSPSLRARMMALGELSSTLLGSDFLKRTLKQDCVWFDARPWLKPIVDSSYANESRRYLSVSCEYTPDEKLQKFLSDQNSRVFITQGFIAQNDQGQTVLLGRGGSDVSASYFAAKLQADCCEIWTDVPGMFTADPRFVKEARLLQQIDYDEAQECASAGAKVLHPRCLEPVRAYNIPLEICWTDKPHFAGTRIAAASANTQEPSFKAISVKKGITLVSMDTMGMWQQVGFLADVFVCFKKLGLSIDLVSTSESNVTVSLDSLPNTLNQDVLNLLKQELAHVCKVTLIPQCAAVSVLGRPIRQMLHKLAPLFDHFKSEHVYLLSQASSDLNLTFVVQEDRAEIFLRKIHDTLFKNISQGKQFGPTWDECNQENKTSNKVTSATTSPIPWWIHKRGQLLENFRSASPAYIYDQATLRERAQNLKKIPALKNVFYAVKANSNADILNIFNENGLGFECVSWNEVEHVRKHIKNITPERILFTPNFAPREEYEKALQWGTHVTVDNHHILEQWTPLFKNKSVLLRFDPGIGKGHHKYVHTAGNESKFGIPLEHASSVAEFTKKNNIKVTGLHVHPGSGILASNTWMENAEFLAQLAKHFSDVSVLNIGGGLGVPDRPEKPHLNLQEVEKSLQAFQNKVPQFQLWLEPGRYLVAESGVLLAKVTQKKQKGSVTYIGIEAGMNALIRPALYDAYHEIVNLSRLEDPRDMNVTVVGPVCESGDVLGTERLFPSSTQEGDLILIAQAGAYGFSMSSRYTMRDFVGEKVLV